MNWLGKEQFQSQSSLRSSSTSFLGTSFDCSSFSANAVILPNYYSGHYYSRLCVPLSNSRTFGLTVTRESLRDHCDYKPCCCCLCYSRLETICSKQVALCDCLLCKC